MHFKREVGGKEGDLECLLVITSSDELQRLFWVSGGVGVSCMYLVGMVGSN